MEHLFKIIQFLYTYKNTYTAIITNSKLLLAKSVVSVVSRQMSLFPKAAGSLRRKYSTEGSNVLLIYVAFTRRNLYQKLRFLAFSHIAYIRLIYSN